MAPETERKAPIKGNRLTSGWQEARARNERLYPNSYGGAPAIQKNWITAGRRHPIMAGGKIVDYHVENHPPFKRARVMPTRPARQLTKKQKYDLAVCSGRQLAVLAKRDRRAATAERRREAKRAEAGGAA